MCFDRTNQEYLWKISKWTRKDYWVSSSLNFFGLTLPFGVFYLFDDDVSEKTIKNANDSNHWNANDSCPVKCYFFFPLWIKQVFVLAFFGITFLNYNSHIIRFSHDKHICIYLWVNFWGFPVGTNGKKPAC